MIPADLSRAVVHAVRRAVEAGELDGPAPPRVVVERSRPGGVGEYASPVALRMGRGGARGAGEAARVLASALAREPGIEAVEVTGPGFLNFTLAPLSAAELVRDVRERPARYGCGEALSAESVVGGSRERVVRTAVARIRESQGLGRPEEGDGEPRIAPVARRDGDVLARYGAGAAVWAMLAVPARETPVFGDALLVQGEENEVFLVRYAHARVRALMRNAERLGFRAEDSAVAGVPGVVPVPGAADEPGVVPAPGAADAPEAADAHRAADAPEAADAHRAADAPEAADAHRAADAPEAAHAPGAVPAPGTVEAPDATAAPDPAASGAPAAPAATRAPAAPEATADPAASGAPAASATPEAPAATATSGPTAALGPAGPALLRALADHPLVLEAAAHHRAPERLARQLLVVADAVLDFQHHVLPLGDEKPSAAHRARLALAEAAGAVLAGGLALLGIDAPDSL
ncbi:ArgS-related anticodon-binding protein NrtL [Streptomyces sp. NPDC001591]|uniref:ArgS-related anticodon-binding protein NrtL n=1 Tax=Streptomyces sp. NPDC001591 TaxID=3364589 RepID=UPI0036C82486